VTTGSWRCPLCKAVADDARQHLADVHGVGSGTDRFGLRDAVRPRPTPPRGRSVPRPRPRDDEEAPGLDGESDGSAEPILTWRRAPRPRPRPRPRTDLPLDPEAVRPARPAPLPPDAAILRLVCETLDGVDAAALHDRLVALPGVESAAIDLYGRTVDLYLDRTKATPRHLVTLAAGRVRLPVRLAELHRAAPPAQPLGDATRIYVVQ
jgi:hypothetical protein